jgi:hypothetical protein
MVIDEVGAMKNDRGKILTTENTNTVSADNNGGKGGLFSRFLATVEFLGNLLPHPVTLFALLSLFIVVLSGVLGYFDIAVADPRPEGAKGREADGMIEVISLMSAEGLQRIVTGLVTNFTGFAPLGTVLVALLGVSVAEHSGLLSAAMRALVMNASQRALKHCIRAWLCGTNTAGCYDFSFPWAPPISGFGCSICWRICWIQRQFAAWHRGPFAIRYYRSRCSYD